MHRFVPDQAVIASDETLRASMDIFEERAAQRVEFGEQADDEHAPAEWIARVAKHLGRAVSTDPATFRREMVVVGALALAALESFDRRYLERSSAA